MEAAHSERHRSEVDTSNVFFLSGMSGILIAAGYIVITALFVLSGPSLPKDAASWIQYLDGKFFLWWWIIWLSIITDILYLPFSLGLFQLLKENNRGLALASMLLFAMFVLLELSLTWSKFPAVLDLVQRTLAAESAEVRLMLTAAIEAVTTEFNTPVAVFYTIFIPSTATVIISVVMLMKSIGPRAVSIVGALSGTCNIVSSAGRWFAPSLEQLVVAGSFLSLFWFFGVGVYLLQRQKQ